MEFIYKRYNREPLEVNPWASNIQIALNNTSNQNLQYIWRPDRAVDSSGVISASIQYPLFFGSYDVMFVNEDSVFANQPNGYAIFYEPVVSDIPLLNFYNYLSKPLKTYGIGTFAGSAFPAYGLPEFLSTGNQGNMLLGPFLEMDLFTDGTGAVSLNAYIYFSGFRAIMA